MTSGDLQESRRATDGMRSRMHVFVGQCADIIARLDRVGKEAESLKLPEVVEAIGNAKSEVAQTAQTLRAADEQMAQLQSLA